MDEQEILTILKSILSAAEAYQSLRIMLQNGATPDELATSIAERDAALNELIVKTGG